MGRTFLLARICPVVFSPVSPPRTLRVSESTCKRGTEEDMQEWNKSLSTETKKAFQNHMTVEGMRDLEQGIMNGKAAKKRGQTTTLRLGDDPKFL